MCLCTGLRPSSTPANNKTSGHLHHHENETTEMARTTNYLPARKNVYLDPRREEEKGQIQNNMGTLEEELKAAGLTWGTAARAFCRRCSHFLLKTSICISKRTRYVTGFTVEAL